MMTHFSGSIQLSSALLMLAFLSLFSNAAFAVLLALLGLYFACVLVSSVITCRKNLPYFWVTPWIFMAYHMGYGYGTIRGIWDFLIVRKFGGERYAALTRGSSKRP